MSIVISIENLSKTYHLGQIGTGTFSRDLEVWWAKLRGKPNALLHICSFGFMLVVVIISSIISNRVEQSFWIH